MKLTPLSSAIYIQTLEPSNNTLVFEILINLLKENNKGIESEECTKDMKIDQISEEFNLDNINPKVNIMDSDCIGNNKGIIDKTI